MPKRRRRSAPATRSRGLVVDMSDANLIGAATLQSLLVSNPDAMRRLSGVTIRGVTGDAHAGYEILASTSAAKFVARVGALPDGAPWRYPDVFTEVVRVTEAAALRARAAASDIEIADASMADAVKVPSKRRRQ